MKSNITNIAIAITCTLYSVNIYANGNIIIDTNRSDILSISKINDLEVIHIEKANKNGVSHNYYEKFNVSEKGIQINNHSENVAKIIINEVTLINPNNKSYLNGNITINGEKADLIIANPNGIECNNCFFTNTPSTYLTAGEVSYFEDNRNNDAIKLSSAYKKKVVFNSFNKIINDKQKMVIIGDSIYFNDSGYIPGKTTLLPSGQGGYIKINNSFTAFKRTHDNKTKNGIVFNKENEGRTNYIRFGNLNIISNNKSNIDNHANLRFVQLNVKTLGNFNNYSGSKIEINDKDPEGDFIQSATLINNSIDVNNLYFTQSTLEVDNADLSIKTNNDFLFFNSDAHIKNSKVSFNGNVFKNISDKNKQLFNGLNIDQSSINLNYKSKIINDNNIVGSGDLNINTKYFEHKGNGDIDIKDGSIIIDAKNKMKISKAMMQADKIIIDTDILSIIDEGDISGGNVIINVNKKLDEDTRIYLPNEITLNGKIDKVF